jgi:iron complex outermembrane receptor protein
VINKTSLTGFAVLAIAFVSSPALAQLEEIVVTATKREQTLQDIPVAVTVTKGVVLERAQIQDIIDLQSVVPSLHVEQEQTSTNTNFLIRGFGNGANNPGIEPSVGVFIDGVYRSRSAAQIGDMVDVDRVEVLRGPQSTLFGQNASAGVISIVSKQPSFTFGGDVEVGVGNYSEKLVKARLTGPISDTLAFSIAGTYNKRDGYFKDLATGGTVNDRDRWDVHGQLLYKPSNTLTIRLLADVSNINEVCCAVVNLLNGPTGYVIQTVGGKLYSGNPFDRKGDYTFDPTNSIDNSGLSLHFDWDLDTVRLSSITAYRAQKASNTFDVDFTSADLAKQDTHQRIHTFTQEFRLASNKDSALNWMVGGYYIHEDVNYAYTVTDGADFRKYANGLIVLGPCLQALQGGAFPPAYLPGCLSQDVALGPLEHALGLPAGTLFGQGQGLGIDADQTGKAVTLFGQLDWKIADPLKLTLGLAHTTSKKDVTLAQHDSDVFSSLNLVNIGFGGALAQLTPVYGPALAAQLADQISVTPCPGPAALGGACNQLLGLYPLQFLAPVVPYSDSSNDGQTTYTARLSWNLAENLNLYGGVSTGFKATSWNLSINSAPLPPAVPDRSPLGGFVNPYYGRYGTRFARPEKSTVYEIGLKGQWQALALNVALFDESIKDFQSNLFTGTGFNLANAGKQSTKGVEIEAQWKPNQSWEFSLAGTFMDPKYDSYVGASCISPATNNICDLSGHTPSDIHKQTISSAVTYLWRANSVNGFIRLDHLYADNIQLIDNVPAEVASQKISTLNASTGVSFSGWDVSVWCRNLNNDNYLVLAFPSVAQPGSYSGYTNPPRTFGLTLRKNF